MAESFDPYYKWLAIPPAEQPANHYRLLGLALLEDDADAISSAADRQMAHVRTFQTGAYSALSQKLLNELAAARLCLLDRQKKAAYDAELRAQRGEVATIASPVVTDVASRMRRHESTKSRWIVPAAVSGSVLVLLLGGWLIVQFNRSPSPAAPPKTKQAVADRSRSRRTARANDSPAINPASATVNNPAPGNTSPPPTTSAAGLTVPVALPDVPGVVADRIVVWNSHNDVHKDRGAREFRLILLKDDGEVWKQDNIEIPWSPDKDENVSVAIPPVRFDRVRVEIVKYEGVSGSLAEIEVFQGESNLARGCPAAACFCLDDRFPAAKVTDGITTSFYNGYWTPHDVAGWVEVDLAYTKPRPCEGVQADKLIVWNSHNAAHNDRGALEISVKLLLGRLEVWRQDEIQMPWQADEDRRLDVPLPQDVRFDRVRIDVNRFKDLGGSLAEVQVLKGEQNLAVACPVQADGCLNHYFRPECVVDGITSSLQESRGYWCSYNNTGGWLEIDLSCNCPEIGEQNKTLGAQRALGARDWPRGSPWLARTADAELRKLALLDSAQPRDPNDLTIVGDGWWNMAQASEGKAKDALLSRALFAYSHAVPRLGGLDRERLRERVRQSLPFEGGAYLCFLEPSLVEQIWPESNIYSSTVVMANSVCFPYGLWMHPAQGNQPGRLVFNIEKKYGGFYGAAALNDSSQFRNTAAVTFKILGDQRLLWSSPPIKATGAAQPFDIDITGVGELELRVDPPQDYGWCHAVWLDPRLELSPPTPDNPRGVWPPQAPVPEPAEDKPAAADLANKMPAAKGAADVEPKRALSDLAAQANSPIPDEDALREAGRTLRQRFKSEWSGGKDPAAKLAAARTLAEFGSKPPKIAAERYVLWEQVRSLACAAGDVDLACEAIGEICREFDQDAIRLKQESFTAAAKGVNSVDQAGYLLNTATLLILEAVSADKHDAAKKLAAAAQTIARKTKDPAQIKTWAARGRELAELSAQYEKAKSDAFASGQYDVTARGDWPNGLPKLAKSGDAAWRPLAEADLAHAPPADPKSLAETLRVADGWRELAEHENWLARYQLRRHATALYKEALPAAGGEERNKIEQRFLEQLAEDDGLPKWDLFEPGRIELHDTFARIDPNQSLQTLALYRGPIDATIVARSDSTNIRLHAFVANGNFPGVIWNWEVNPRELRVHHVDATLGTTPVTPLEAGRWYALRWVVTDRDVSVFVDGKPVFNELHANPRFPPSALSVGGAYGSIVDVRKIVVRPLQ